MTPKEKAKEIVNKIKDDLFNKRNIKITDEDAVLCTLIAVDEIINSSPRYPSNVDWDDCGATHQYYYEEQREEALKFWQEVKTEIEKL